MIAVYRSGQTIPEWEATIEGAVTVVAHSPADIEGIKAVCELAGQPPQDRMTALYETFQNPDFNVATWLDYRGRISPAPVTRSEPPAEGRLVPEAEELLMALDLAREVWVNEPGGPDGLRMALSIADPHSPERRFEISAQHPALTFHRESPLRVSLMGWLKPVGRWGRSCVGWAINKFSGLATDPDIQVMRAINKAREAELARGAVNPLLSLADAVRDGDNQLANRRALIVFVHGFCALDVGTFDLLLNRLRASPRFGAGVALAGFPHFTLLPVVENAEKLCDLFTAVTARNLPVACVAHSRGGLVVRCAAARFYELYSHDQARTRLLCGCIAFGTPHEGTPLAALPDQLVGTVVTAMQRRAARGNAGLLTLLRLYQKHKTYEGVEDLMPTAPNLGGEPQRFVDRLEAKEREVGRIRLYVIGGDMDGQPVPPEDRDYLMWRALEPHYPDGHHDWVVPMDSSAPYRFENGRQEVTCNHFDYFEDNQGQILDEAVDLLEVLIAQARDAKKAERARQPQTARE